MFILNCRPSDFRIPFSANFLLPCFPIWLAATYKIGERSVITKKNIVSLFLNRISDPLSTTSLHNSRLVVAIYSSFSSYFRPVVVPDEHAIYGPLIRLRKTVPLLFSVVPRNYVSQKPESVASVSDKTWTLTFSSNGRKIVSARHILWRNVYVVLESEVGTFCGYHAQSHPDRLCDNLSVAREADRSYTCVWRVDYVPEELCFVLP